MLKRINKNLTFIVTILCLTLFSSISCSVNKNDNNYPLSELIELDENNWGAMLNGEWMVEFFAPWCPACKTLSPTWEKFAKSAGNYNLHVAKIDVTKSPSLSGRFFVTALPTIYHVINGEFRQYRGPRNGDSFLEYVREEQWKKIEPLSAWKQPNSIHMSILSWFFKLSHYLKDVNTRLHEEYGLPTWGSYALFAIATIFIGAILGLFLVCVVDFLYPPKKMTRQTFSEQKKLNDNSNENILNNDGIENIAGDDIEDEEQDEQQQDGDEDDSTSEGEKNSGDDDDDEDDNENEQEENNDDSDEISPENDKNNKQKKDTKNNKITEFLDNEKVNSLTTEVRERKNINKNDEEVEK